MATYITELDIGAGPRIAIKDLIDLAGYPTTAGCRALADLGEPATTDAACMREIVRRAAAGEVRIIGKTNLHELAYGTTGVNEWFGTPRNPLDSTRIPGGSSSGSATAVADGDADVALGSDTGGSVRIPAACCGVAGLKTTWNRIPRDGVWPLAPSLDTIGPMARDVSGLVVGMQLLEPGFRPAAHVPDDLTIHRFRPPAAPDIDDAVDAALNAAGFTVVEVADPGWDAAWTAADVLLSAEAWRANRDLLARDRAGVSAAIVARIEPGAAVTEAAQDEARATQRRWQETLGRFVSATSVLALPTLPDYPPPLDVVRFAGNRLNLPINFAGLPSLALPVPTRTGFPASVQLVGPPNSEEQLLAVGRRLEAAVGSD